MDGIGAWTAVLDALNFLGVLINTSGLVFASSQVADRLGVYDCTPGGCQEQEKCAQELTDCANNDYGRPVGPPCLWFNRTVGCVVDPVDPEAPGLLGRINEAALWALFYCINWTLVFVIFVVSLTPLLTTAPLWIQTAREILAYQIELVYRTDDALEREKRFRAKHDSTLASHMDSIEAHLDELPEARGVAKLFQELDVDHSGFLGVEEVGALFTRLGVDPLHLELAEAMQEMDTDESDGSSQVSLDMLVKWLHKRGLLVEDSGAENV